MSRLKKSEQINILQENFLENGIKLTKKETLTAMNTVFDTIVDEVGKGNEFPVYKFCTFFKRIIKGKSGMINGAPFESDDRAVLGYRRSDYVNFE